MSKPAIIGGNPVNDNFIAFHKPLIKSEEINEVIDTLRSGWITTGPKTFKFEEMFKNYIHSKHAIALNSGTAALHLSLVAAGINKNDEVITSPFTFTATSEVIIHQGGIPRFVDIEEDTYNIDPLRIEEKITNKTKAIMPVHYGGHPCDMDPILEIADEYDILIIEDAAHAMGTNYKLKKVGCIGDTTCFSFYATKNLTTAEGGMVTTDNDDLAEKIRMLGLHGITRDAWKRYSSQGSWYYEVLYPGFKYNHTDLQASIGIHQLKRFDDMQLRRRKIAEIYNNAFEDTPEIITPVVKEYAEHAWHLYPILLNTELLTISRDKFIEALKAENVGTSVHFIPLHLHPYYKEAYGFNRGDFPIAESVYNREISLPIYPLMTDEDVQNVISAVKKIVNYYRCNSNENSNK